MPPDVDCELALPRSRRPLLPKLTPLAFPFLLSCLLLLSPYTGSALTCHLSQSFNAVFLLGASSSAPSDIYIYSFGSSSWSTQSTSSAPDFSKTSTGTVLDHDTNTFFTLAGGTALSQLDVSALNNGVASGSSVAWEGVNTAPFDSSVSPQIHLSNSLGGRERMSPGAS